jgi:hypothetical protein
MNDLSPNVCAEPLLGWLPKPLRIIHGCSAAIVILLSVYGALTTFDHSLFPQWQVLAVLAGSYAAAQLWWVLRGPVPASLAASFYLLMPVLVFATLQAIGGYAKSWAPATAEEARQANFLWFGVLAVVATACALTFVLARRPKANAGSRPAPG